MRVTGTLSKFNLEGTSAKYLSVGDEILVKNLGEVIKDDEYNSKFDNWVYNTPTKVRLVENTSKFTSTQLQLCNDKSRA